MTLRTLPPFPCDALYMLIGGGKSARDESSSSRASSRSVGEEEPEVLCKGRRRGRAAEVRAAVTDVGPSHRKSGSSSGENSPSSKKRKKLKVGPYTMHSILPGRRLYERGLSATIPRPRQQLILHPVSIRTSSTK